MGKCWHIVEVYTRNKGDQVYLYLVILSERTSSGVEFVLRTTTLFRLQNLKKGIINLNKRILFFSGASRKEKKVGLPSLSLKFPFYHINLGATTKS